MTTPDFLRTDQGTLSTGKHSQDGGRTEVVVGSIGLGAIRPRGSNAGDVVCVAARHLSRPHQLAGVGVERENSVRGISWRV